MTVLDEILFDLCRKLGTNALTYDAAQLRAQAKSRIKQEMLKAAGSEPVEAAAFRRRKTIISRIKRL
jgi:hypothetical protein